MKRNFFINIAKGAAIGTSMIIPGVSGGTVAAILNIYEDILNAVANLRTKFKESFMFLLPILIGGILGIVAMYFPIKYALQYAELPTIALFAGLILGGIPPLFKKTKEFKLNVVSMILSICFFALVIGLCFIPGGKDVDLSSSMQPYQYVLVLLIGILVSSAFVMPGISGSMLLLILGYYQPIFGLVSGLKTDFGHSIAVLLLFALGVLIGFFSIASLMKYLLNKFPRGTYFSIMGLVVGSVIAIFLVVDYQTVNLDLTQIILSVVLFILGTGLALWVSWYANKKAKAIEENKTSKE